MRYWSRDITMVINEFISSSLIHFFIHSHSFFHSFTHPFKGALMIGVAAGATILGSHGYRYSWTTLIIITVFSFIRGNVVIIIIGWRSRRGTTLSRTLSNVWELFRIPYQWEPMKKSRNGFDSGSVHFMLWSWTTSLVVIMIAMISKLKSKSKSKSNI